MLGLSTVEVVRARAEDLKMRSSFDVVTSRAVAELSKLAGWSMPLVRPGGLFLPMKGASAEDELSLAVGALRGLGASDAEVWKVGAGVVDPLVSLVAVRKADKPG